MGKSDNRILAVRIVHIKLIHKLKFLQPVSQVDISADIIPFGFFHYTGNPVICQSDTEHKCTFTAVYIEGMPVIQANPQRFRQPISIYSAGNIGQFIIIRLFQFNIFHNIIRCIIPADQIFKTQFFTGIHQIITAQISP